MESESRPKRIQRSIIPFLRVYHSIGYDRASKILEMQFEDGWVLQYYGVPNEVYDGFVKSKYLGEYYNLEIRPVYPNKQVGKEPLLSRNKNKYEDPDDGFDVDEAEIDWDEAMPAYDGAHNSDFGEWVDAGDHWVWDPYTDDD